MLNQLTTCNSLKEDRFFLYPVWREDDCYWLPYDLYRCVAKKLLGGFVPRLNDAIQILGDDRIVGQLNDGRQPGVLCLMLHSGCHRRPVPLGMSHPNFAP